MTRLRLLLSLAILSFPLYSEAMAQTVPGILQSEEAGRDRSGDEPFDIPELFGSKPFEIGKNGALPELLAEYAVRVGEVYERISIFDNGVASIHLAGRGPDVRKRLVVADDAMKIYRQQIATLSLRDLPTSEFELSQENVARLRIVRNGSVEERKFPAGAMLPREVENFRLLLNDLLDAITADQQITNPITTYQAAVGDRLMTEDQKMYEVKRILQDGTIVEVELVGKSIKMYVPTELLPKLFIDVRVARREP